MEAKNLRNQKRDLFTKLIEEAKANNAELKRLRDAEKTCKEYFESHLEKLEHRLITQELTKEQEKALNVEIISVRRRIKDAESAGNIEAKLDKAEQRKGELNLEIEQLKEEKKPLEDECNDLKEKMDAKNEHITKLKG